LRLQLVASGAVRHTGSDADADEDVDVDVERRLLLARPWSLARPDCRGMMTVVDVASVYVGMEPNRQRPALSGKVMWELRAMQCNAMQCNADAAADAEAARSSVNSGCEGECECAEEFKE